MTTNRVFVNYSETYDLNTVQDKLTVIGFHTPTSSALYKMFDGFYKNFKKVKYLSCDIAIACASQLPIDPLGVGTEPGTVAPQDVLNPMLFKACTGEQINVICDTIYNEQNTGTASIIENKISGVGGSQLLPAQEVYYTLLADNSWRKAHPQSGMVIRNLVPMVHEIGVTRPFSVPNEVPVIGVNAQGYVGGNDQESSVWNMGSVYTPVVNEVASSSISWGSRFVNTGVRPLGFQDTVTITSGGSTVRPVPKCWLGCLVMPPAKLQSLYYRIVITWHLEFAHFRPFTDLTALSQWNDDGLYVNLYDTAASPTALDIESGSLDASGVSEIIKVNSSAF